ncbi:MAG: nickel-dependent hydrogenase large subunit, partial [Rhodoferax sp.]|nr:nickel-dependent hydrogenase large subunit [Rhodoferax sp.]
LTHPPITLWLETARDHLRSMALDWPQHLPEARDAGPDLRWLDDCPLPLAARHAPTDAAAALVQLGQLRTWLESRILGQSIHQWLQDCAAPEAFADWCQAQAHRLPPVRYLRDWYPQASRLHLPAHSLQVLHQDPIVQRQQLSELAQAMAQQSGFVQHPSWRGQCVENGPWTRLRHGARQQGLPRSAWWRLSARWLELLTLAQAASDAPDADCAAPMLATGALWLAQGQALGWCEMARGLLLHWVQLDAAGGVLEYRVLAPTEWNFHPQGALAQAVARLASNDQALAAMLAAAYDPCVRCTVAS